MSWLALGMGTGASSPVGRRHAVDGVDLRVEKRTAGGAFGDVFRCVVVSDPSGRASPGDRVALKIQIKL